MTCDNVKPVHLGTPGDCVAYRAWTWHVMQTRRTPFDNGTTWYLTRVERLPVGKHRGSTVEVEVTIFDDQIPQEVTA